MPSPLTEAMVRRPAMVLGAALALHVLVWTLLPSLIYANPPLDVIEGLVLGGIGQWGNAKHPPLQGFLLEPADRLGGGALWTYYLLSQLTVAAGMLALFALGQRLLAPLQALLGVLVLEGVIYFNFTSTAFNPNVMQVALWALVAWAAHGALGEDRLWRWALLGMLAGLAVLAKYFSALLLLSLVLFFLLEPQARRRLRGTGPWLALALFGLVLAPHLAWLAEHRFESVDYALRRGAGRDPHWFLHLWYPLRFAGAQLLATAPALLLLALLCRGGSAGRPWGGVDGFDRRFLLAVCLGPVLLLLAFSAIGGFRLRSMWGAPLWGLIGLLVLAWRNPDPQPPCLRRFARAWAALFLFLAFAFSLRGLLGPWLAGNTPRGLFPGEVLAAQVSAGYREVTGRDPGFVVGTLWLAGNVSRFAPARPRPYILGDAHIRPPEMERSRVQEQGAVILWRLDRPERLSEEEWMEYFPGAVRQPPLELAWQTRAPVPPVRIGWAVLPPSAGPGP